MTIIVTVEGGDGVVGNTDVDGHTDDVSGVAPNVSEARTAYPSIVDRGNDGRFAGE